MGSKRRGRGAFDSGMKRSVSRIAASADREVEQEDRAPADRGDERPAHDRPERHRDAEHRAPDAHRLGPLARVREGVGDDRHRDRVHHRGAHRLEHAERHEQLDARGQAAQERGQREHAETRDEGAPATEPVRGGAREHQQARHHDRVGADRPLQPRDAGVQLAPDRRQRDVHDRDVEPDDEQAQAADRAGCRSGGGGQSICVIHNYYETTSVKRCATDNVRLCVNSAVPWTAGQPGPRVRSDLLQLSASSDVVLRRPKRAEVVDLRTVGRVGPGLTRRDSGHAGVHERHPLRSRHR